MLGFYLVTDKDKKEAAKVERRRRLEDERKKCIFDTKYRLIGIDKESIEKQILEKRRFENEEKLGDQLYEQQQQQNNKKAMQIQAKIDQDKWKIEKEIIEYRKMFQKTEDRREFDLNDLKSLKKSPAINYLRFDGEDLNASERTRIQMEQTRAFLHQQMQERKQAENERQAAERAYQNTKIAEDRKVLELDYLDKDYKRRLNKTVSEYNAALAKEQNCMKKIKEQEELADKQAEILNNLMSNLMCDNSDIAESNFGPHRKIPTMFKGMSKEQLDEIYKEQQKQIEENKKKNQNEILRQNQWDQYLIGATKKANDIEMETQKKRRELAKHLLEENRNLANEQRSKKEYLDNVVYTNSPTQQYYDQFNNSSR